jgi:hypothetical protein
MRSSSSATEFGNRPRDFPANPELGRALSGRGFFGDTNENSAKSSRGLRLTSASSLFLRAFCGDGAGIDDATGREGRGDLARLRRKSSSESLSVWVRSTDRLRSFREAEASREEGGKRNRPRRRDLESLARGSGDFGRSRLLAVRGDQGATRWSRFW